MSSQSFPNHKINSLAFSRVNFLKTACYTYSEYWINGNPILSGFCYNFINLHLFHKIKTNSTISATYNHFKSINKIIDR